MDGSNLKGLGCEYDKGHSENYITPFWKIFGDLVSNKEIFPH
jgi:hypothetical protein